MTQPAWVQAIEAWRRLSPEEKNRRRLANLPRKVARSMAFEGEPVDQHDLEVWLAKLRRGDDTSSKS